MRVTVFGLGEAGSEIAAGLARAGAEVHAYDPAGVPTPRGVTRHDQPQTAVEGVILVMAVTAASDAPTALAQAVAEMRRGTVYADLSTAPPALKESLAETAAAQGLSFVDVALMAPVPGRGLATPSLASGRGAAAYADVLNRLGASVEVIGDSPGEAAARKLIRSIVTKGLTALLLEALETAHSDDSLEWAWGHLAETLTTIDRTMIERLIEGTGKHIHRRLIEMESAQAMIEGLGVPALMTAATVETLRRIGEKGMPEAAARIGEMP